MGIVAVIGAVIGAFCLLISFTMSGAPQQAALAGMACAFAVIPYVIFRVFQLGASDRRSKQMLDLMKAAQKPPTQ